jgi:U6 snRNA-associated Sm-like protein LSm5
MKNDSEVAGTLRGFDDYVNMVLDDVTEISTDASGERTEAKLDQILLNGNSVAVLVPGGEPHA